MDKLYKYVSSERFDILENGLIRFSQPRVFNDPFEMKPTFSIKGNPDKFEWLFKVAFNKLLTQDYYKTPEINKNLTLEQLLILGESKKQDIYEQLKRLMKNKSFAEKFTNDLNDKFADNVGILSLTEKNNNLLMWSHYGQQHHGFVIEFDVKNSFFDQRKGPKDELRHLRKVKYEQLRPKLSLTEAGLGDKDFEIYLTKSKEWEYEKEWRLLMPLENSGKIINENNVSPIFLYKYPKSMITSIYLGCRATQEFQVKIESLIKKEQDLSHIKIYKATEDKDNYSLNFHKHIL